MTRLRSGINHNAVKLFYQFLHKVGRRLCQGIYVDLKALERVKMLTKEPKNRIIFVPSNKSFTDLIIFQYINYMQGLNIGYTFSALEDTPKLAAILYYVKYTGVFLP